VGLNKKKSKKERKANERKEFGRFWIVVNKFLVLLLTNRCAIKIFKPAKAA